MQPIRSNRRDLQKQYRELLLNSANFHTLPITAEVAEEAERLRGTHALRLPDAIQIASAINAGCDAIVCNDRGLQRVTEIRVLLLDELEL